MRVKFMSRQEPVKIVDLDRKSYIFICLNEETREEKIENNNIEDTNAENTITLYEYDYAEIILEDPTDDIINDIKNNPEKYCECEESLSKLKEKKIQESKDILKDYLVSHPLFSKAKYNDGRYYNVTEEKQRQLTSKVAMYNIYNQQNLPYNLLKWNDTGDVCEEWTIEQLTQLAMEIDAYVTPLVSKQQTYEVCVNEASTKEEVNSLKFLLD